MTTFWGLWTEIWAKFRLKSWKFFKLLTNFYRSYKFSAPPPTYVLDCISLKMMLPKKKKKKKNPVQNKGMFHQNLDFGLISELFPELSLSLSLCGIHIKVIIKFMKSSSSVRLSSTFLPFSAPLPFLKIRFLVIWKCAYHFLFIYFLFAFLNNSLWTPE